MQTPVASTTIHPATPPIGRHRPARALIGWLAHDAACALLSGQTIAPYPPGVDARATTARAAVSEMHRNYDADHNVIVDAPSELQSHMAELASKPSLAQLGAQGWRGAIVDLRKVRALQPLVHCDHAEERTREGIDGDVLSLARITVPLSREKEYMKVEGAPDGRRWTLTCRNPHLRFLQPFGPDPADYAKEETKYDPRPFGFLVELARTYVQVIRWRGIYLLTDGYHRTHGLLARGIYNVPVLFLELPDTADAPIFQGLFPPSVYLSEQAPHLGDYFDDRVSASVRVQATQRTLIIQASEVDVSLLTP